MITLPDGKICNNLPEQVAKNAKDIFEIAQQWNPYKEELEADLVMLAGYLADMSSAAIGAIAGQTIAPANVSATASVSAPSITGDSIIENMSGYSAQFQTVNNVTLTNIYTSVVKNGNKLTFVSFFKITKGSAYSGTNREQIIYFTIPSAIGAKLYPITISGFSTILNISTTNCVAGLGNIEEERWFFSKQSGTQLRLYFYIENLVAESEYVVRCEQTFLLSDDIAS